MDKNNTYHPDDIEELLIQKEYKELSEEERTFVDSQIDNPTEYSELRNTLLSIKKIANEEQSILVSPSIKQELLDKFEQSKSRASWFSLNSIGEFLFPSNTSLFRKPGLQFAVAGALLLLVVNIGLQQFNLTDTNLAINTNEKEIRKESPVQTEGKNEKEHIGLVDDVKEKATQNRTLEKPEANGINQIKVQPEKIQPPPSPTIESIIDVAEEDDAIDDFQKIVAADDNEIKGFVSPKKVKRDDLSADNLSLAKDNKTLKYKDLSGSIDANSELTRAIPGNINADTVNTTTFNYTPETTKAVSLDNVVVTEVKRKPRFKKVAVRETSQSLAANEEVIDLLFVTE